MGVTTKQDLNRIAQSLQTTRVETGILEPGDPVTVNIMPPTWQLSAIDNLITVAASPLLSSPITYPLKVAVEWQVFAEDGTTPLAKDQYSCLDQPKDTASSAVSTAPSEASFVFAPSDIIELTTDKVLPLPKKRFIVPIVKLSLIELPGGNPPIESDPVELNAIQVSVQALAIPTVLALFRHVNYSAWNEEATPKAGGVFIMTPYNSPLKRLEDLQQLIAELKPILSRLTFFAQFVTIFLAVEALSGGRSRSTLGNIS